MQSHSEHAGVVAKETWNAELAQRPKSAIDWVWSGYLARGALTLLTSQWKTGKTTLSSVLLAKMAQGGELRSAASTPTALHPTAQGKRSAALGRRPRPCPSSG